MTKLLLVIAERRVMGRIRSDAQYRLIFAYDEDWRSIPGAYPLSLSMPLTIEEHGHDRIEPWLWGLLPDNPLVIDEWGRRHQVYTHSPFSLLTAVGEDCAGAVQMVRPERVEDVLEDDGKAVEWLDEAGVERRLQELSRNHAAWRIAGDEGYFSLAGAQPKTTFVLDGQRWGVPRGSTPTTHIFKPPVREWESQVENEHLCLSLASALGLPSASSEAMKFGDQTAVVIRRYDRSGDAGSVRRVHQEDMCQAFAMHPRKKYQKHDGPACEDICRVIRANSLKQQEDAWTFAQATMLNWIIGGTDAHAKNFSMLLGSGGQVRLAPLYDVASMLPYLEPAKLQMATRIGDEYHLEHIGKRQWTRFARETGFSVDEILEMGIAMAEALPDAFALIAQDALSGGLDSGFVKRMVSLLDARAERCAGFLASGGG